MIDLVSFMVFAFGLWFGFAVRRIKSKYLEYFDRLMIFIGSVVIITPFIVGIQPANQLYLISIFVSGFLVGLAIRGVPGTYVI